MKTTNSAQTTDNRQLEGSSIASFTLVLSLVLLSITVSANGFGKYLQLNNSLDQMASMMDRHYNQEIMAYLTMPAAYSSEIFNAVDAFFLETSAEKVLEIESWMTNEHFFVAPIPSFEMEVEEPLSVEEWMLTDQNFIETTIITESDRPLDVEEWMLDESIWGK